METETSRQVDVLIAGAGFAGLPLAIALRQALGTSFEVVVADPAHGAQPILDMAVTDSRRSSAFAAAKDNCRLGDDIVR